MITDKNVMEKDPHQFYAEASDLRLPPGKWPQSIPTTLGNGLPFVFRSLESGIAHYVQGNNAGTTLSIFND